MTRQERLQELSNYAEEALLDHLGLGKPPGKAIEVEPRQRYDLFVRALQNAGFKTSLSSTKGVSVFVHPLQGGNWQMVCKVSTPHSGSERPHFSMYPRRKKDEHSPSRKTKGYGAPVPGRSPQDLKKYVRWVMNKVLQ